MTDTVNRPLAASELDAMFGAVDDAALAREEREMHAGLTRDEAEDAVSDADRIAALEASLEWEQRQRELAEDAQAVAEEATRAAEERIVTIEAERDSERIALVSVIAEYVVIPWCADHGYQAPVGEELTAIAETLAEDLGQPAYLDALRPVYEIDPGPLVRGWAEETGR